MKPEIYRPNVAAFVINEEGFVLACERSDMDHAFQLPQGGIEEGEKLEDALRRELKEEIGVSNFEIVDFLDSPIRYEWPETLYYRGFRGQEQWYFLVKIPDISEICLNSDGAEVEFKSVKWMNAIEFVSLVNGFKKEAYKVALDSFIKRNRKNFKYIDIEG